MLLLLLQGAHHLDLMFSHPLDPPSVIAARKVQLRHIKHWIKQAARAHSEQQQRLQWWRRQQPGYEKDEQLEEDVDHPKQQQQQQQQHKVQQFADHILHPSNFASLGSTLSWLHSWLNWWREQGQQQQGQQRQQHKLIGRRHSSSYRQLAPAA
jgi:hypothetical protein